MTGIRDDKGKRIQDRRTASQRATQRNQMTNPGLYPKPRKATAPKGTAPKATPGPSRSKKALPKINYTPTKGGGGTWSNSKGEVFGTGKSEDAPIKMIRPRRGSY